MELQSETLVLILAAGESRRFDGPSHKQLLEIHGETVIGRIVRMVSARGFENIHIVSQHQCLAVDKVKCLDPEGRNRWTCETLLSTDSLWSGFRRVVVLLGDTYYTVESIDTALYIKKEFCVYSDSQDIFALSFSLSAFSTVRFLLAGIVGNRGNSEPHNRGRLWELYRSWHRLPDHATVPLEVTRGVSYEPICDITQDFDTMDEYLSFLQGISKNVLYAQHNI